MNRRFSRAIIISVATALLASCGGSQAPIGTPGAMPHSAARLPNSTTETILHSFAGGNDGQYPAAAPISIGGDFYGTTALGGNGGCPAVYGCGTVYKLSGTGHESILHVFTSGKDGEAPNGSLIEVGGNLIGTTVYGGGSGCKSQNTSGCGTVFEMTRSGRELVLYRFPGHAQGALPTSGLTRLHGELYGEAAAGGTGKCAYAETLGCGLLFKMSASGHVTVLYTFKGGKDGGNPDGGLLWYRGNFYGTTIAGGSHACYFSGGCGTVFKITPSGSETTVHEFTGHPNDGALPDGLAIIDGVLYGTTDSGGKYNCGLTYYLPCGTVYKLTLSGKERVIYNFNGPGSHDGSFPNQLVAINSNLYGTTQSGGEGAGCGVGCGTFFKVTPSGRETVLYSFKGGQDGSDPNSALLDVAGTLYGTTGVGGTHARGTVFAVAP